jgi:hypothetical protein
MEIIKRYFGEWDERSSPLKLMKLVADIKWGMVSVKRCFKPRF